MDYMSNLPSTKHGNECVFMVIDRFSKMVVLAPWKKSIATEATAKISFENVWVHFGIPQTIASDQDSRFLSIFRSSLWSMMDTKLTKLIAFHPQTDGQTEVVNGMIVHILRCTTPNIYTHGMKSFLMFNIATIDPSPTLLATILFKCAYGSNHWPSLT
jgi:hypothetical protein